MSCQELNNQLKQILDNGFTEEFIIRCTEKLEKTEFSPQKKSIARLYLFYLSGVLKSAVSENTLWTSVISQIEPFDSTDEINSRVEDLICDAGLPLELGNIALAMGAHCYVYIVRNKKSGEDFSTLFVDLWFGYLRNSTAY